MALQFRQTNSRAYARGQEELQNRLKKLRDQKDIVASVIENMMQRAELAASRITSVTNINEFLRHFEAATGTIDRMYMKMFQVHFLLTAEEAFAASAHCLRAPMAITYSVPDSMARNGAQSAPLETTEALHCFSPFSRPPSVASLDLSVCDDVIGPQPARTIPRQYRSVEELGPQPAHALPQQYRSVQELGPQAARALPQQYRSVEELGRQPPQAARALPQQYRSVEELGCQPPQAAGALPQQYRSVQELGPQPARALPQQYGSVEEFGPQAARVLPQQYRSVEELGRQPPQAARALPQQYGSVEELSYSAARGQRTVLPSRSPAYSGPGAPSKVEVPHGLGYPVPGSPRAHSRTPEDSGAQARLATPLATLTYGGRGPQQQFAVPPACTSRGDVPEIQSPTPPGCTSPATQFSDALSDLALPPTPGYRSPEGQCKSGPGTWPEIPSSSASLVGDSSEGLWSHTGFGRGVQPNPPLPPTPVCVKPQAQCSNSLLKHPSLPTPVYKSPEAEFASGPNALPKLPSLPTPRYESTEAQFAAGDGPDVLPELSSPSTLPYTSLGAQLATELKPTTGPAGPALAPCTGPSELNLPPTAMHTGPMAPPTGGAEAGHVEVPSCSAVPCAEAPEHTGATAGGVALPPVKPSSSTPQKPAKEAIKDVHDRGDACSLLAEADQVNNNCSQPQGEGKPAGKKATVSVNSCSQPHGEKPAGGKATVSVNSCSQPHGEGKPAGEVTVPVPPGFVASNKQPSCTKTDTKSFLPGHSSSQTQPLNAATVGSAKSQSPGSHKSFAIPPADTSIIGSTQKVVFSFYKSPSEFWLQLESSRRVLDGLLNDLAAHYQSTAGDENFKGTVGMHCVAHYMADNHWYRAQILEVLPDHVKVCYVDFGNCDRVRRKELRHLTEQFASIPAQAFCCSIKVLGVPIGQKIWPLLLVRQFWNMVNTPETKLEAVVYLRDTTTGRFIVDILGKSENKPVVNMSQDFLRICKAETQKANQVGPTAKQPPEDNAPAAKPAGCEPPPAIESPAGKPPATSNQHATPPCTTASGGGAPTVQDGTISLETSAAAAAASGVAGESESTAIPPATAIVATGPPPTSAPAAGAKPPVTTRAGRPGGAPRAVPDVAKPAAPLPAGRPPSGIPPAGLLSEGAVARLAQKRLPADIIGVAIPPETVPAVPPPLPPLPTVVLPPGIPPAKLPSGKTFSFILSVVFSPSDFYGQILADNGTRELMENLKKQLNQHGSTCTAPPPESVAKGSFWVCYFEGDKNYYRVQILDVGNTNNGWRARVLYVDYGNRSVVDLQNLRPLPGHLAKPPAWAHRLALAMVSPVRAKWEEAATKAFVAETGFKTVLVGEKRGQRQAGLETVTEVVLWNKNGETPVNINILLVEKKLAQLRAP
ncbi:uncharacterized protein LOC144146502 isoform X3 [Haemaphysalis longicornis]